MRLNQLRQLDLNLLIVFTTMAEERNVSRAAVRLLLSQPAVTRAMQRIREAFNDELLVRVSGNYELTPKGSRLLRELEATLPHLDRLLEEEEFNAKEEKASFQIAGSDYAAQVLGDPLVKRFLQIGPNLSLEVLPLSNEIFDSLERGRLDLVLYAEDGRIPETLRKQTLYEEDFVCLVSKDSPVRKGLSDDDYIKARHIGIVTGGRTQTVPEQRLNTLGLQRETTFRVPYFESAMRMIVGTELVATVPRRLAKLHQGSEGWRSVNAPPFLKSFAYLMVWHPRLESDSAHVWLRKQIAEVGHQI